MCEKCSKFTIKTPERRHWRRSGVIVKIVFTCCNLNMLKFLVILFRDHTFMISKKNVQFLHPLRPFCLSQWVRTGRDPPPPPLHVKT